MTIALVTSCTHTRTIEPVLRVQDMPEGLTMEQALDWWMTRMNESEVRTTPRELYRGQGFFALEKLLSDYPVDGVRIVTGGQGLIELDEPIVPYDFTASAKEPHNIHQKVTAQPYIQTVWWKMINEARGKGMNPVAQLVKDNEVVIIALGKVFVRYISDDLLSLPYDERDKVRILLAASSLGSVPAQLRPMIIPYDQSKLANMPGNRNDTTHRAAYLFMRLFGDEEFPVEIEAQRPYFISTGGPSMQAHSGDPLNLEQIIRERPHIHHMSPEEAFKWVRREFGALGGRVAFNAAFRKVTGATVEVGEEEVDQGLAALKAMGFTPVSGASTGVSDEEEVLKGLKTFVEALRKMAPTAVFTNVNVVEWAKTFYSGKKMPEAFESAPKLMYYVKSNASLLGVEEVGKGYRIK